MKTIAALFLSLLLAVMAYGIFWWICLAYTTSQLKDAVSDALQAQLTYGMPQWVPDPAHVTMDLPNASLTLRDGPIREIHASSLVVESDFLMRDRFVMKLPKTVEISLANGKKLLLETADGQVVWLASSSSLSLRASSVRLLDLHGTEVARIGDVMLERKVSDNAVRLNIASRPHMADGDGVLSGQVALPAAAFANVVNLFGDVVPTTGGMLRALVESLKKNGGTLELDNVSFKMPGGASGAVYGNLQVIPDGRFSGNVVLTSDTPARILGWFNKANLFTPRTHLENVGVARFSAGLGANRATVRMESMQDTLMLNGSPVGSLPNALQTVSRLWP